MKHHHYDLAIVGAGIVGISTAYYLKKFSPDTSVALIDASAPMSLTSAQSGENYRNWWPHPIMTAFTDRSIDLMEELAKESGNIINMNRRGYVLATRADNSEKLMDELAYGYSQLIDNEIRIHENASTSSYQKPISPDWQAAPSGVDVIRDQQLIKDTFPSFDRSIKTVVHIRRAGAISSQQMGQYMISSFKNRAGKLLNAEITAIDRHDGYQLHTNQDIIVNAERIVNAAGPYIQQIANMMSTELPISNILQQKITFEDTAKAIPRKMPFAIDLDSQHIDWTDEERALLAESSEHAWLTQEFPGATHCRPEGGDNGTWIKLGWAFNTTEQLPSRTPELSDSFAEIALRGAARLNPALKQYVAKLPASLYHYGGFYTLTDENWPLIGPMPTSTGDGSAFVVGAMSGFGTMAAASAGELCARLVKDTDIPDYASALSPGRYANKELMNELSTLSQRGIL